MTKGIVCRWRMASCWSSWWPVWVSAQKWRRTSSMPSLGWVAADQLMYVISGGVSFTPWRPRVYPWQGCENSWIFHYSEEQLVLDEATISTIHSGYLWMALLLLRCLISDFVFYLLCVCVSHLGIHSSRCSCRWRSEDGAAQEACCPTWSTGALG